MGRLLVVVAILAALAVGAYGFYESQLRPMDFALGKRISLTIDKGSTATNIASQLKEAGLIRSELAFKLYVRSKESSLQAGEYILLTSSSVPELVDQLGNGKSEEVSLTIPEGFTVKQIDELLAEKGLIDAGELLECARSCDFSATSWLPAATGLAERGGQLEGYLYPDTYFVSLTNFSKKAFLDRLLRTFSEKVIEKYREQMLASDYNLHDLVTMASLIEEEAITDKERPVIAGILFNRLEAGMGLGVDATVRYIVDKPRAAITITDLDTDSPYNTRKYAGLPPGPIASPGMKSIEAALKPSSTDYWYYLHGTDGIIRYGTTLEEHNVNKQRYL